MTIAIPARLPRNRPKIRGRRAAAIRLAVYRRDGYRCIGCGWQPPRGVPDGYDGSYALGGSQPGKRPGTWTWRYLDLDHIRPYSLGGPFTVANLQALCTRCNCRKGARV